MLWALPLAAIAIFMGYQLRWIGDDAFISFRYAKNLVAGHGLVWNPGERVEGYTNFLWTILMALGLLVGVSPIFWSVLLSLSSLGALVVLTQLIRSRLGPFFGHVPVSIAALLCTSSYVLSNFGTSGLETMFAASLVLAMALAALHERWILAGSLGVAAALCHPDHILFHGALGLARLLEPSALGWARAIRVDRARRNDLIRFAIPFLAAFVPYFVWRYAYYGDFYPNTYYAKSGGSWYLLQGGNYLLITLFSTGTFFVVPLALWGAFARRGGVFGRFVLIILPLFCLYTAKIGGDFMMGRLLVPLLPFAFLAGEEGLRDLAERSGRERFPLLVLGSAGLFLAALPIRVVKDGEKFWHVSDERSFYPIDELDERGIQSHYRQKASDLKNHVLKNGVDPLLGAGNVGVVGFLSGVRIVDLLALNDRAVAHMPITIRSRPGHEKIARGPYLVQRQVDLSDDPIYPDPYSVLSQVKVGRTDYFLSGFKPSLVDKWRGDRGVRLPKIEQYIRNYIQKSEPITPQRLACDAWFFDVYFFEHNRGTPLLESVVTRLAQGAPQLEGAVSLFFRSRVPDHWTSRPQFDFDNLDGWKASGNGFRGAVVREPIADLGFVHGEDASFVASFPKRLRDGAQGELTSPEFEIEGEVLSVDVGGGSRGVGVELLVDGAVVATVTGCDADMLGRKLIPTGTLRGKMARLRIFDRSSDGWGHVLVDNVRQWTR